MPPKTMTFYAQTNGLRRLPISLPFVASLNGDPKYSTTPPVQPAPAEERPLRWSESNLRKVMGRDRERTERLKNEIAFQATLSRIGREGW